MSTSAATKSSDLSSKRVVFIHPDLGIGGAERLVIDAAVGLQTLGCKVTIFTSHCDPSHCFTEARDGTLDVRVRGNTIFPPSIRGRFAIFCAIARQIHLILSIALFSTELSDLRPTHFFIDQLSAGVPLLRFLSRDTKILFYCHFPDKLLALQGSGLLWLAKSIYRIPFNWLESWSTSCSDDIVVNSNFTGGVVKSVFPSLRTRSLKVLYPCVDTTASKMRSKESSLWPDRTVLLSINRFERKKGIDLTVRAFAQLTKSERKDVILVLAGGYDPRLSENVQCLKELQDLAGSLSLTHTTLQDKTSLNKISADTSVLFLPSVPDALKQSLLDSASLLVYTPRNEHFGIVPLEAMLNEVPVLAAHEGGPIETVVEGKTGWLRDVSKVADWTTVMRHVITQRREDRNKLTEMGQAGKARVQEKFSIHEMAIQLDDILERLRTASRPRVVSSSFVMAATFTITWITLNLVLAIFQIGRGGMTFYSASVGLVTSLTVFALFAK